MTSKEAVKVLYAERAYTYDEQVMHKSDHWFSSIIHYDNIGRSLSIIEKDLEVLEILKHHIHLIDSKLKNDSLTIEIAFIEASGFILKNSREYGLLKDWVIHND